MSTAKADDDGRTERSAEPGPDAGVLVPARILNEHVYCPRLAWLEWEARAFTDNLETVEGRDAHRRVDEERGSPPEPPGDGDPAGATGGDVVATAVTLSSDRLGVVAKLDRVERRDGRVYPVETKRGRPRTGADGVVWEPELAQLTVQALLLREEGHAVEHAEVFFAATRTRHEVGIPGGGEHWIRGLVDDVRANAASPTPPPPLVDSPKCDRCSLAPICLPDETNLLRDGEGPAPRRLVAKDDPAAPLHVVTPGSFVRRRGGRLVLEHRGERVATRRLLDVSHVAAFGNVSLSGGAMRACLDADIPVVWFSAGGWLAGYAVPNGGSWVARRVAQHARAAAGSPELAAAFVAGKIRNQRTLLRRLGDDGQAERVDRLTAIAGQAGACGDVGSLLGLEGTAARWYFDGFPALLTRSGDEFVFEGRNRRPPTDPVNAMLSFAYALLLRDAVIGCLAAGLDPQVGFLHRPRFGRPSLALDLAEEFRPLVADSAVIMAVNNGEIRSRDMVRRGAAVGLTDDGRRRMIAAYERRVSVSLRHPLFGYDVSYRRAIELQARQLAAVIEGQLERYRPLTTR